MRPGYIIERERPSKPIDAPPKAPADGACQVCHRWAPYLVLDWPDPLWRCPPCSRPPDDLIGVPLI